MIRWLWEGLILRFYTNILGNSFVSTRLLQDYVDNDFGKGTFVKLVFLCLSIISIFAGLLCLICL